MKRILISVFLICIGNAEILQAGSSLLTVTEAQSLARSAAAPSGVTKLEGFTRWSRGTLTDFPIFISSRRMSPSEEHRVRQEIMQSIGSPEKYGIHTDVRAFQIRDLLNCSAS
jgi:hypothetical protein